MKSQVLDEWVANLQKNAKEIGREKKRYEFLIPHAMRPK